MHLHRCSLSVTFGPPWPDRSASSIFHLCLFVASLVLVSFTLMRLWCLPLVSSLLLSTIIGLYSYLRAVVSLLVCIILLAHLVVVPLFSFVLFSALVTAGVISCTQRYLVDCFLLYWFCSDLDWRVQRVTANFSSSELELSSNGSSELTSDSFSKLSSHQVLSFSYQPFRWVLLPPCGTTTAKGLYANFFFVLTHYAFEGVRAQALSVFVLSTSTVGVEQACSAAARVPPRSPSPKTPLLRVPVLCLRYEASSHPEGGRRRIQVRIRPPFVIEYVFIVVLSHTRGGRQPGRLDVFPDRD